MSERTENAIIESVSLDDAERGFLTGWVFVTYGGGSRQGFGGYRLYLPKGFKRGDAKSGFAGHFIWRCMEIGGVTDWSELPGKAIRVRIENGLIAAIGHIIKDDWFCPADDWKDQQ